MITVDFLLMKFSNFFHVTSSSLHSVLIQEVLLRFVMIFANI